VNGCWFSRNFGVDNPPIAFTGGSLAILEATPKEPQVAIYPQ
jgi:hypothetical protein